MRGRARAALGSTLPDLARGRLLLMVALLAAATYANALGNGWALDDEFIVAGSPGVTEARWGDAIGGAYWTGLDAPPALWRPATLVVLTAEWRMFGDRPGAFHAVSLALHAGVSVLVTLLLAALLPGTAAAAGGALFAVHPVHVEAVANVVGQSELLAAAGYLGACLLYLWRRGAEPVGRALATGGVALLYALALGAKESAVTLPGALVFLELLVPSRSAPARAPRERLVREAPLALLLAAVLAAYLVVRVWVLGAVAGELIAPELEGLGGAARVATALSLWPTYLRLLIAPLALSADYGAGVLFATRALPSSVVIGGLVLAGLVAVLARSRRATPWAALAAGWLVLTMLPVSQLLLPTGTLLAERTLYLPSVAAARSRGSLVPTPRVCARPGEWAPPWSRPSSSVASSAIRPGWTATPS